MNILIISPTPSHPTNAGNRVRIFTVCERLKNAGFNLNFLYVNYTNKNDVSKMASYFGEKNFYSINTSKRLRKNFYFPLFYYLVKLGWLTPENCFNYPLDYLFDEKIISKVHKILAIKKYDLILVQYVFLSKIFDYIPDYIIKIIDTHDKFSNRWKIFLNKNVSPKWYSTWPKEEKKGLDRADLIIGIQETETKFFQTIVNKKAICIRQPINFTPLLRKKLPLKLLFIGSNNQQNFNSINRFIKIFFPILLKKYPKMLLLIGGGITKKLENKVGNKLKKNIKYVGFVDNVVTLYQQADIVINPTNTGTGLKIKNVEALGYSKYLITTTVGAEGLEKGINSAFLVADTPKIFVQFVQKLFDDSDFRDTLQKNILKFVQQWNNECDRDYQNMYNEINFLKNNK